jgi:hypothetical protein
MPTDRESLFCDTALAERIERAEVDLISAHNRAAQRRRGKGVGFLTPVAGGVTSFADDGSPYNKVAGLGFSASQTRTTSRRSNGPLPIAGHQPRSSWPISPTLRSASC